MDDDLNTPQALASLQGFRSDVNRLIAIGLSAEGRHTARETFRSFGAVLGLFQLDRWDFNVRVEPKPTHLAHATFTPKVIAESVMTDVQIETKLAERIDAKKCKDFKRADVIREELNSLGITIEDKPDGTTRWKR